MIVARMRDELSLYKYMGWNKTVSIIISSFAKKDIMSNNYYYNLRNRPGVPVCRPVCLASKLASKISLRPCRERVAHGNGAFSAQATDFHTRLVSVHDESR